MSSANVVTYIYIDPPADDVSGQHIYVYVDIYLYRSSGYTNIYIDPPATALKEKNCSRALM